MLRRELKERKAYLREKQAEIEQKSLQDKKAALQESLRTNKPIPHSIRGEAAQLLDELVFNVTDEEENPPLPRIVVTTSHSPSSQLKAFSKHLSLIFNAQHMLRGRMTQDELSAFCIRNGVTHLLILNEAKGNPTTLIFCRFPHGPTYKFSIFRLRHQRRVRTFGEKPYLVVDGMTSTLGKNLKRNLSLCFPAVKDGNRLVALVNRNGTVAFRHFLIENRKLVKECEFDMKLFKSTNSTFECDGDVNYILNAFTNTKKEDVLVSDSEE